MRGMQLAQFNTIENAPLSEQGLKLPKPGKGQLRIKVQTCGVCRTDLHIVEGEIHPPRMPIVPGHQVIGLVEKLGKGVTGINLGDRVGVPWLHRSCKRCVYCQRGEENLCGRAQFTGYHVDGGFAEFMLADADYVLPIPQTMNSEEAAPLLCAGIIGYRSLHKADLKPGEILGLFGFGASAHLAIQVAIHWSCEVYVFTRSRSHRRHARKLGAKWAGRPDDSPPTFLDRAVIFAPSGAIVPLALEKIRPGGTLAINAIHMTPIPEMEYRLIYGERTLRSVANATLQDGIDFLNIASEIPIQSTVNLYPLAMANQALEDVKHSRINGEAVLVIQEE
jgi:propanol-preferring alcohol dehydrogenase